MEEIIYPINLDLRTNTHKVLVMKEGDYNSRVIEATITNNGKTFNIDNCTVDIKWRKPDGHIVYSEVNKLNSSTIRVVCTEQMLCVSGISVAEIVITDSNSVVSTLTFNISVNETVASDFDIESSDEFGSLRQMKEHIANNDIHIPEGGTAGQAVVKDENGNVTWGEVSGGSSGDYLEKENPVGTGAFSMNRKTGSTVGDYSVAMGNACISTGSSSIATGNSTSAIANFSFTTGNKTTASGSASHAEGTSSNNASDIFNHTSNFSYYVSKNNVLSKWDNNKFSLAYSASSHVEGMDCLALCAYSHAEGYQTRVSGSKSGEGAHAEGYQTRVIGDDYYTEGAHAEGYQTISSNKASHAEGNQTTASGSASHAEGTGSTASGFSSHAEGGSEASGYCAHAEGSGSEASGDYSHAEGGSEASGIFSHAEGYETYAKSDYQHVQGKYNITDTENKYAHIVGGGEDFYNKKNIHTLDWEGNAVFSGSITGTGAFSMNREVDSTVGKLSVAIGEDVVASGDVSFAEGCETVAEGKYSHAEGWRTTASSQVSHSEGQFTTASGYASHAEGNNTLAEGGSSHSEGLYTTAHGAGSHAEGYGTISLHYQHAGGCYNDTSLATENNLGTSDGTAFVIGNGTGDTFSGTRVPSNAFRITGKGVVYAKGAYNATGADYAEYSEWADGNPDNEDRRGYFVTFDEENPNMIRKANNGDYILGVTSGNPCIIGNSDEGWLGKYVFDEFGGIVYEEIDTEETYVDETGEEKTRTVKVNTYKINPEFDPTKKYVHRSKRQEWAAVGWIGVLSVRDDGSCIAGGYCKASDGGIATKSERDFDTYRVLERVTDNVVKIALK